MRKNGKDNHITAVIPVSEQKEKLAVLYRLPTFLMKPLKVAIILLFPFVSCIDF